MLGMDRNTGKAIGAGHLAQSIGDILTTPRGTRVMRRPYGTDMDVIDSPVNAAVSADIVGYR